MNDPELATRIAIECLKDTGLSDREIDSQIAGWKQQQGCAEDWWEMPQPKIERLARSLQKAFERRYQAQGRAAA